jgi:hypothetical protein
MSTDLSFKEAARLAQVSHETISYWVKTGRLAVVGQEGPLKPGRPGRRVIRQHVLDAMYVNREAELKRSNPGNLLTVRDICRILKIQPALVYKLTNRFSLEKTYIDGWSFMIDGEVLHYKLQEDPTYWYLLLKR